MYQRIFRRQRQNSNVDLLIEMNTRRILPALALFLLPILAFAGVAVDQTHAVDDNTSFTGTATSTSVTVASGDTLLLVFVANYYNGGTLVSPDTFTYGGVSLTKLASQTGAGGSSLFESVWYLISPAVGTATLAGTWTTNTTGGLADIKVVPVSGAATSSTFGTAVPAHSTANNNPAVTATGSAGSVDLYFGSALNGIATTTSTGTGQTDVLNGSLGGGNTDSQVVSIIPGNDAGAFTWTGSGSLDVTHWAAIGFVVHAPSGGSCTNNFWSSTGTWAVPNGTTGSYWSTTGAFLTPNCSTGSFWLKSGAIGSN